MGNKHNPLAVAEPDGRPTVPDSPYIHAATSDNIRLAYQSDIRHFLQSGGTLPATPDDLKRYLKDSAPQYNARTLTWRMTALRQWHRFQGVYVAKS